jgi:hypothetical protein
LPTLVAGAARDDVYGCLHRAIRGAKAIVLDFARAFNLYRLEATRASTLSIDERVLDIPGIIGLERVARYEEV